MTTKEELAIEKCEESDWETDKWDKKFSESVKRFHNIVNCENCDGVFTPDHQC